MKKIILTILFIQVNKIILIIIIHLLLNFANLREKKKNNNRDISQPKISIFLPIFNKAKYLKRSIESIQNQTIKEIEIIPVNISHFRKKLLYAGIKAKKSFFIRNWK